MAGIYVHIPFCRKACHYCDFHFSTSTRIRKEVIEAILTEIRMASDIFSTTKFTTLYFGGGTPSFLTIAEFNAIFEQINKSFDLSNLIEFTIEANPEDCTPEKLSYYRSIGVNRFSLGVQTFNNQTLKYLNRNHDGEGAIRAIQAIQNANFNNFSCDLIYGIFDNESQQVKSDLKQLIELEVPHISAYCLTIEENTVFGRWKNKNRLKNKSEDGETESTELVWNYLHNAEYEQYEISNFALNQKYAIHNRNYWNMSQYLGIGPGAHSFFGGYRWANIANNALYVKTLIQNVYPRTIEQRTQHDLINEYILTSLRTIWGIERETLNTHFNQQAFDNIVSSIHQQKLTDQFIVYHNKIVLSSNYRIFADYLSAKLFLS